MLLTIGWCLISSVISNLAQAQPAPNPFIMLIFDPGAGEAWTMNAMATGAVAVCRQTSDAQGAKHNECRQGTQPISSYDNLESLGSGLRPVPGQTAAGHGEFKIIMSQYGAMQFDRSQLAANSALKQLADQMTQTNRRVGGDDFVPRF
jgi:hypothetical protein